MNELFEAIWNYQELTIGNILIIAALVAMAGVALGAMMGGTDRD